MGEGGEGAAASGAHLNELRESLESTCEGGGSPNPCESHSLWLSELKARRNSIREDGLAPTFASAIPTGFQLNKLKARVSNTRKSGGCPLLCEYHLGCLEGGGRVSYQFTIILLGLQAPL